MNLIIKIGLLTGVIFFNSSLYSIHIKTLSGVDKSMQDYSGKKIMIVILPSNKNTEDTFFLKSIDSVSKIYSTSLSVIAVISLDDGFYNDNAEGLKNFYRSFLDPQITITSPLHTRKGSEDKQHELFSWLTHKEKNVHFDMDVSGANEKFFINERGELYGVIAPNIKLTDRIMQRMMQ
jgi:glutathione peroxidase